jgi:hypothetical protein
VDGVINSLESFNFTEHLDVLGGDEVDSNSALH